MDVIKIGIASDHGGFELKKELSLMLEETGYEVIDYGNTEFNSTDDYPDYIIPLASAIANNKIERGIAVCGSGVGACIAANKIQGVRACLINDSFSAHQGVEDDDMNMICLGGRITGRELAKELVKMFLSAQFSKSERHQRRLAKITVMEDIVNKRIGNV